MPSWEWRDRIREIARGWLFSDVPPESFPRSVVLPLENPDLYDDRPFIERLSDVVCYKAIAIGSVDGRTIGIARSKFGAPAVAMAVESLAGMGVERIVSVGYCGGLSETLRCGELVLPLAAVRDEGTTARYVPEGYPAAADFDELCGLRALALTQELRHHVGLIWSTDAPLLESSELVRTWGSRGVLGVDMELSALFTFGPALAHSRSCDSGGE